MQYSLFSSQVAFGYGVYHSNAKQIGHILVARVEYCCVGRDHVVLGEVHGSIWNFELEKPLHAQSLTGYYGSLEGKNAEWKSVNAWIVKFQRKAKSLLWLFRSQVELRICGSQHFFALQNNQGWLVGAEKLWLMRDQHHQCKIIWEGSP